MGVSGGLMHVAVLVAVLAVRPSKKDTYTRDRSPLRHCIDLACLISAEYGGRVAKTAADSILAWYSNPADAFRTAIKLHQAVREYRGTNDTGTESKIAIHAGDALAAEDGISGKAAGVAGALLNVTGKNEVCLSEALYQEICNDFGGVEFTLVSFDSREGEGRVYKASWEGSIETAPGNGAVGQRFVHHALLGKGPHRPCFYCGSRKHSNADCPSRFFARFSGGISEAGYHSMTSLNGLFRQHAPRIEDRQPEEYGAGKDENLVVRSFLDINRVFQLRMLRILWDNSSTVWDTAQENDVSTGGGTLWLGRDCLRISHLAEAEETLLRHTSTSPGDYRAFCALGFLAVDKNELYAAEVYFRKVLSGVRTKPQRIFILFLLFRVATMFQDSIRAQECLREILRLDQFCKEAIYLDILTKLRYGEKADVAPRMRKLVERDREYYLVAMLDPELEEFQDEFLPELHSLFIEARDMATARLHQARGRFSLLAEWTRSEKDALGEIEEIMKTIRGLMETDSYYGYLDAIRNIDFAGNLITSLEQRCFAALQASVTEGRKICAGLRVRAMPFAGPDNGIIHTIKAIEDEITFKEANALDEKSLEAAIAGIRAAIEETKVVEKRIRKLERRAAITTLCVSSFKQMAMFFILSAAIGFTVVPALVNYVQTLPGIGDAARSIDQWALQKWTVIIGTTFGTITMTLRQLVEKD